MEKLIHLIDSEMSKIGGQKIQMPTLIHSDLWKKTGRWERAGSEVNLFFFLLNNFQLILSFFLAIYFER